MSPCRHPQATPHALHDGPFPVMLLGIESATDLAGVCIGDDDGCRAAVWTIGRRRHAETLAPAVAHVVEQTGIDLASLSAVAVDIGPGLFTGLRVGIALAKGLAQGLGVGVMGVGSLSVLAQAAHDAGHRGRILAAVDARRGEVFAATFHLSHELGPVRSERPPRCLLPDVLASEIAREQRGRPEVSGAPDPILAVGDGAIRYADVLTKRGVSVAGSSLASPTPDALVRLALGRLTGGERPAPPGDVAPDYLRGPDAKINWRQRSHRPLEGASGAVQPEGAPTPATDPPLQ